MTNLDAQLHATLKTAPRTAVSWVLMASYLYYHKGISILSDEYFDEVCKVMGMNWEFFDQHRHAHLITPIDLHAGSLYRLREEDYPEIVKDTAWKLARELEPQQ